MCLIKPFNVLKFPQKQRRFGLSQSAEAQNTVTEPVFLCTRSLSRGEHLGDEDLVGNYESCQLDKLHRSQPSREGGLSWNNSVSV